MVVKHGWVLIDPFGEYLFLPTKDEAIAEFAAKKGGLIRHPSDYDRFEEWLVEDGWKVMQATKTLRVRT